MDAAQQLRRLLIAGLVIDITAIGLRCWVRLHQAAFAYDDAVLSLSLIGFILFSTFLLVALHYGYGALTPEPWHDLTAAIKFFIISQLAYVLTSAIVKTGVALVLFRININRAIRNILLVSMVVVFVTILTFFFLLAFQCRPISLNWGVGKGECFPYATIRESGIALSIVDISSNWLYSLLPIVMVHKVHMRRSLKAAVIFLLGIGVVSSIATAVRFKYILQVKDRHKTLSKTNEIENNVLVLLWSHLELFLAILASSLVALRPVLRRVGEMISERRSNASSNSDQGGNVPKSLSIGMPKRYIQSGQPKVGESGSQTTLMELQSQGSRTCSDNSHI
ncbi:hypothetical protein F5X98DRAFT_122712 [Xylaria grammica]|nr:hypothetical protein F5X98DRAFT_122712 [Xylaria grammica]